MNNAKFRFHTGGLKESLETQTTTTSYEHLLQIVNDKYTLQNKVPAAKFTHLKFEYGGFDNRINQETYYVIAYRPDKHWVVGMSDSIPPNTPKKYITA